MTERLKSRSRRHSAIGIALVLAIVLLSFGPGCGRDPHLTRWTTAHVEAEHVLAQGEHADAMKRFKRLEKSAHFEADVIDMRMRQAEVHRRAGRFNEAATILKTLEENWDEDHDRERLAEIVYKRGRIVIDGGHTEEGEAILLAAIDHFPKMNYGLRAFTYMRGRMLERDENAFIDYCGRAYERHRDTPLADNFLYEAGRVFFERNTPADDLKAERIFVAFLKRWGLETSGFWDDAMWELSLIYHRQKRFKDEIRLLGDFLYTREETWLGSYELKNYKFAHLRIAKIHYFDFQDYRKAAELFAEFPGLWPYSIFKDDALWWEAHAWRKAGEHALAAEKFAELVRRWPDSKYTRRVKAGVPSP